MKASDDELMKLIGEGQQRAFATLFDRHAGVVLGYATRLMGSRERAEDVSQEVWMKLVKQSPHYSGQGNFIAWVYTIVRNTSFNALRSQKKLQNSVSIDDENTPEVQDSKDMFEELARAGEVKKVQQAIDELPDLQRLALSTYIVEDIRYAELASRLDLSVPALKSVLFRARKTVIESIQGVKND